MGPLVEEALQRLEAQIGLAIRDIAYLKARVAEFAVPGAQAELLLEHFPAKWMPVRVEKMRQIKRLALFPDSIEAGNALAGANNRLDLIDERVARIAEKLDLIRRDLQTHGLEERSPS